MEKSNEPDASTYKNSNEIFNKLSKREVAFTIPKAERKFHFSKFNSLNREAVKKGLI